MQGAASPRPRIRADLVGSKSHPADQQPGGRGPPVRTVVGHRDLSAVHVDRVGPVALGDTIEDPPQRGDALGADRELDAGPQRGAGQRTGEVAGISAQQYPRRPRRGG